MISEKSLRRYKYSTALTGLLLSLALPPAAQAQAQQNTGYAPPPMFEDMTPPMVRPEARDGNIVSPKTSARTTDTDKPMPRPTIVMPRSSSTQNAVVPPTNAAPSPAPAPSFDTPPALPAPVVETAPVTASPAPVAVPVPTPSPAAPAPAPTAATPPKMMQPIIDEADLKRESRGVEKPAAEKTAPKEKTVSAPPKKPEEPKTAAPVPAPAADIPVTPPADTKPVIAPAPAPVPAPTETPAPKAVTVPPAIAPAPAPDKTETAPSTAAPKPAADASVEKRTASPEIIKPAARDPKESAIKGPKTMPSLPPTPVDGQPTFEGEAAPASETIMERHLNQVKQQEEQTPIVPAPKANVTPATFDPGEQGALKKSIVFQPGQIGLVPQDSDPIAAGVSTELAKEENKEWRVQIRAFATPYGNGLSSDKRIALSRALSLRTALIEQGVAASRIDVMAEGLQTDASKPGDRIDLYLYGPR